MHAEAYNNLSWISVFLEICFLISRVWSSKSSSRSQMETEKSGSAIFPEVVVGDPELLEKKKAAIRMDGPKKLQVVWFFFFFCQISDLHFRFLGILMRLELLIVLTFVSSAFVR